jgi:hypothetical protein
MDARSRRCCQSPTLRRVSRRLSIVAGGLVVAALTACGDSEDEPAATPTAVVEDPGPVHVHGLGVNPADGALFIATHTGLFRSAPGERGAQRVADRFQDTMGFTVVGPNRFLGSGHPDRREDLPPFLGLLRSTNAGKDWHPISLLGERDFHVLEASGRRIYGYGFDFDTRKATMLISDDGGRTWDERVPPEPLVSLAIDPGDPDYVVAAGERGTYASADAGREWRPLDGDGGLLAWGLSDQLIEFGWDGTVRRSRNGGAMWDTAGAVGGRPAAAEASARDLYVALHDGTIKRSKDAGRSWSIRATPDGAG